MMLIAVVAAPVALLALFLGYNWGRYKQFSRDWPRIGELRQQVDFARVREGVLVDSVLTQAKEIGALKARLAAPPVFPTVAADAIWLQG